MVKDDIHKLIEKLQLEIKKLDNSCKRKYLSEIKTFRISSPQITSRNSNKKFIGLLFDSEFNQLINSEDTGNNNYNSNSSNKKSFLKLKKCNYIINYCLTIKIDEQELNNYCFLSLGIRDDNLADFTSGNKIHMIKGSKQKFHIKQYIVDGMVTIKDTIIYQAEENQQLCLIANFGKKNKLLENKSILKIHSL